MADAAKAPRAWGYHPTEPARIFEDGNLPDGWSDQPLKGQHPHDVERGILPDDAPSKAGKK